MFCPVLETEDGRLHVPRSSERKESLASTVANNAPHRAAGTASISVGLLPTCIETGNEYDEAQAISALRSFGGEQEWPCAGVASDHISDMQDGIRQLWNNSRGYVSS